MFKHILIPTDGSKLSEKAVQAGIKFAKSIDAKVTAVYVVPKLKGIDVESIFPEKEHQQKLFQNAEKYLEVIEKAAKAAKLECETFYLTDSKPHNAIISAAQDCKCDAIFMASHGRGGVAGLLLGSVTTKVLAHTKIPVIVYR
jgi:nucleotide-binding universal stress UspA family protein